MKDLKYQEITGNPGILALRDVPVLEYRSFLDQTLLLLKSESTHCVNYFTHELQGFLYFYILIANDDANKIFVYSHQEPVDIAVLESIAGHCYQMHVFEREIFESRGILFDGHPWLKPLRYPHDRVARGAAMADYPFYKIDSEEIHEVGVGPIHAGIIEPGHFRFLCHGENVLHLEIQLGYQHRGIERLFSQKNSLLQRSVMAENIAGDTVAGHGIAFSQLIEALSGINPGPITEAERTIALEMERMAIHVGDTAALCGDVAYQTGQVTCEALRTMVINTMQDWCGNRFAKGLVRPGGTNYPLDPLIADHIIRQLSEVKRRYLEVTDMIYNDSGVLARFENTGTVTGRQAFLTGAVGMAARSTGLKRDIRKSHPFQAYKSLQYDPVVMDNGDVYARAFLRKIEFEASFAVISDLVESIKDMPDSSLRKPDYLISSKPLMLGISLVEGWRGEICHAAISGEDGNIALYKIKDPSLHNWQLLALAVRDQEISDFPLCNKSFNLSYCGNDL